MALIVTIFLVFISLVSAHETDGLITKDEYIQYQQRRNISSGLDKFKFIINQKILQKDEFYWLTGLEDLTENEKLCNILDQSGWNVKSRRVYVLRAIGSLVDDGKGYLCRVLMTNPGIIGAHASITIIETENTFIIKHDLYSSAPNIENYYLPSNACSEEKWFMNIIEINMFH